MADDTSGYYTTLRNRVVSIVPDNAAGHYSRQALDTEQIPPLRRIIKKALLKKSTEATKRLMKPRESNIQDSNTDFYGQTQHQQLALLPRLQAPANMNNELLNNSDFSFSSQLDVVRLERRSFMQSELILNNNDSLPSSSLQLDVIRTERKSFSRLEPSRTIVDVSPQKPVRRMSLTLFEENTVEEFGDDLLSTRIDDNMPVIGLDILKPVRHMSLTVPEGNPAEELNTNLLQNPIDDNVPAIESNISKEDRCDICVML